MSSSLTFKFFSLLCSVILNETRIQSDVESRSSLLTFVLILLIAVGALPVILTGVHSVLVLLYLVSYGMYGLYLTAGYISGLVCSFFKEPAWPLSPADSCDTVVTSLSGSVLSFLSSLETLTSDDTSESLGKADLDMNSDARSGSPPADRGTSTSTHQFSHTRQADPISAQVQTTCMSLSQHELNLPAKRTSEGAMEEVVVDYSAAWSELEQLDRRGMDSRIAFGCVSFAADTPARYDIAATHPALYQRACERANCTQESRSDVCV